MIDFSVCIETAFTEGGRAVPDRVRAAADAGFLAVETNRCLIWAAHLQSRTLSSTRSALKPGATSVSSAIRNRTTNSSRVSSALRRLPQILALRSWSFWQETSFWIGTWRHNETPLSMPSREPQTQSRS